MKKLLVLFLLIVAASAAAPGFLGMQAEKRYDALVNELQAAGYRITDRNYARGWFSSDARLQVELPLPQGEDAGAGPTVLIKTHVVHGPFLGDADTPFGLGRLDSEVWLDAEPLVVGDAEAPLQTRIGFGGGMHSTLRVPPRQLAFAGGTVDTAAVEGEFSFRDGDKLAVGAVALPSVRVAAADGGAGELAGLRLEVDLKRGPADLPVGGWRFGLERIAITPPAGAAPFALDALELAVSSTANGGIVDGVADYRLRSLTAEGETYGPFDMRLSVRGLPAEALSRVQAAMEELATEAASPEERSQALGVALLANADALLAGNPAIAIEHLRLDTPQGRAEGSLELKAVGLQVSQLRDPNAALRGIEGKAALRLPESLLNALLQQNARQQIMRLVEEQGEDAAGPTAEEIEDIVAQHASQQIESLVAQEILTRDGGSVALAALLRNGLLTVNGKTVPLSLPTQPQAH